MDIVIDLSAIPIDNPYAFAWWFFSNYGWIVFLFFFCWSIIIMWQNYVQNQYRKKRRYIVLAVDIPKQNEQTPKAVEHIFSHLAGAHQQPKFVARWWEGEINDSFSFEIVSIGGYIQFIIHTRDIFRDLIEGIIYAQYPNAEIIEVEDYTNRWAIKFPDDKYDLVGAEIILARDDIYPVITYKEFEDSISGEIKDPMASILEAFSRIGPGEEIWLQFVLTPANNDWGKKAESTIGKITGVKSKPKKNLIDYVFDIPNLLVTAINPPTEEGGGDQAEPSKVPYLTPGERESLEAIEHKISKIGFHTKIRFLYMGEKGVFSKTKGMQGIYGSFKQFNSLGLNSFKPDSKTMVGGIVWFKKLRLNKRKNNLMSGYKDRAHSLGPGEYGYILNTEELASLWHFPVMQVKAPLMKMTESKKAEPPTTLPTGNVPRMKPKLPTSESEPPTNLPTG